MAKECPHDALSVVLLGFSVGAGCSGRRGSIGVVVKTIPYSNERSNFESQVVWEDQSTNSIRLHESTKDHQPVLST